MPEGTCLGRSGLATSCQDTSDGLKAAIESIANASGVGFRVAEGSVPVSEEVLAVCDHLGGDVMTMIMGDSVDFELVFTVPEEHVDTLAGRFAEAGQSFTPIGYATRPGLVELCGADGVGRPLPGAAWRHSPEPGLLSQRVHAL